ncbi:unnamed protein product [Orchesella dallaii]|uniref:Uncharacterized protein n=1 Tax=Orchesella dallaii TaxID=48710 RepID=A0ABP1RFG6_9HEXA
MLKSSKFLKVLSTPLCRLKVRDITIISSSMQGIRYQSELEHYKRLPPYSDEDLNEMPQALKALTDVSKLRVNQFKLIRFGMTAAKKESIRDFEVISVVTDPPTPVIYIRIHHSIAVEKYSISFHEKVPDGEASNPCLAKLVLNRNVDIKSIVRLIEKYH